KMRDDGHDLARGESREAPPPERKERRRQADLDDVAGDEGPKPDREDGARPDESREPKEARAQDGQVPEGHGSDGRGGTTIPASLGEGPADPRTQHEPGEIASRRARENGSSGCAPREHRRAGNPLRKVRERGCRAAPASEDGAHEQNPKRLTRDGHG